MNPDILKAYLIKLGIQVENAEFEKLKRVLDDITKAISKNAAEMTEAYTKAGSMVVGAIVSITGAIVTMASKVAEADMSYQLFAQRMYMSNDAAKAFKISTDALGQSLNEIAWNPELRKHYFELIDQVKGMKTPDGAQNQLRTLRDIGFEWTRLKVEATSAMEWITFHLFKLNKGELFGFKDLLAKANDSIQKNMPEWTAKIASFLNIALQLGRDVALTLAGLGRVLGLLWTAGDKVFGAMPQWAKTINVFLLALVPLLFGSPLIRGIAMAASVLLLLDDAIAHFEGRSSHPFLAFFWDIGEAIFLGITKKVMQALIAWEHLSAFIHGNPMKTSVWDDLKNFGLDFDKETKSIKDERESKVAGFKNRLGQTESGGRYDVPGPQTSHGQAYGKYQIMPESWRGWSVNAGLPAGSPMSPENQEFVTNWRLKQLFEKYQGNEQLVAAAWVGGESRANRLKSGDLGPLGYSVGGGLKETVNDYIKKVTGSYYQYDQERKAAFAGEQRQSPQVSITHGDINVEVNASGTEYTPDQIADAINKKISQEMNKRDLMMNVEFTGVY